MSSALKDARWQLAEEIAEDDGKDLHAMGPHAMGPHAMGHLLKQLYLDTAQERLDSAWGAENVERLAAKFRNHD